MSSFANLKRNASSLEKLAKAIESSKNQSEGGSKDDNRFWTPTVDKAGNGMAIIRFLPAAADDGRAVVSRIGWRRELLRHDQHQRQRIG